MNFDERIADGYYFAKLFGHNVTKLYPALCPILIKNDFPKLEEVNCTIKYVHKSLEDHLSPAFYLIPPIDQCEEHVVYLNHGYLSEGISFSPFPFCEAAHPVSNRQNTIHNTIIFFVNTVSLLS